MKITFTCGEYCEAKDTFLVGMAFENEALSFNMAASTTAALFAQVIDADDELPHDLVGRTIEVQ